MTVPDMAVLAEEKGRGTLISLSQFLWYMFFCELLGITGILVEPPEDVAWPMGPQYDSTLVYAGHSLWVNHLLPPSFDFLTAE